MTTSEAGNTPQQSAETAPQAQAGGSGQQNPRPRRRSRRKKKKSRGQQAARPRVASEIDPVIAAFVACGRCSFFLSGYRAQRSAEAFVEDVRQMEDDWLTLAWHDDMVELIEKSYGIEMKDGLYYLEHCCRECQRTIVYDHSAEDETAMPVVQAQLKPG
jgi:hypothetical protein